MLRPPNGLWRMNFTSNPSKPGLSDRGDNWFVAATTSATGSPTYSYGTTVRNTDGSLTYTIRGAADTGGFDLITRSVTVGVSLAKLNALATRGPIAIGSTLIGLRGSAALLAAPEVATNAVISDSTRGGRSFKIEGCNSW
jgi:hypothetical protein